VTRKNPILALIPVVLTLILISCQTTENSAEEQDVIREEGIVYGTVDGIDLILDLARPGDGNGPVLL